jgi:uncharacterized C2H2 Zn-finger protein
MAGKKSHAARHCGMCGEQFTSKSDLNQHMQTHADNFTAKLHCQVCNWEFDDSLSWERHVIANGHGAPQYSCENCNKRFVTRRGLKEHLEQRYGCSNSLANGQSFQTPATSINESISCDRCTGTFRSRQEYNDHRSFKSNGPCADHNQKHKALPKNRFEYRS